MQSYICFLAYHCIFVEQFDHNVRRALLHQLHSSVQHDVFKDQGLVPSGTKRSVYDRSDLTLGGEWHSCIRICKGNTSSTNEQRNKEQTKTNTTNNKANKQNERKQTLKTYKRGEQTKYTRKQTKAKDINRNKQEQTNTKISREEKSKEKSRKQSFTAVWLQHESKPHKSTG